MAHNLVFWRAVLSVFLLVFFLNPHAYDLHAPLSWENQKSREGIPLKILFQESLDRSPEERSSETALDRPDVLPPPSRPAETRPQKALVLGSNAFHFMGIRTQEGSVIASGSRPLQVVPGFYDIDVVLMEAWVKSARGKNVLLNKDAMVLEYHEDPEWIPTYPEGDSNFNTEWVKTVGLNLAGEAGEWAFEWAPVPGANEAWACTAWSSTERTCREWKQVARITIDVMDTNTFAFTTRERKVFVGFLHRRPLEELPLSRDSKESVLSMELNPVEPVDVNQSFRVNALIGCAEADCNYVYAEAQYCSQTRREYCRPFEWKPLESEGLFQSLTENPVELTLEKGQSRTVSWNAKILQSGVYWARVNARAPNAERIESEWQRIEVKPKIPGANTLGIGEEVALALHRDKDVFTVGENPSFTLRILSRQEGRLLEARRKAGLENAAYFQGLPFQWPAFPNPFERAEDRIYREIVERKELALDIELVDASGTKTQLMPADYNIQDLNARMIKLSLNALRSLRGGAYTLNVSLPSGPLGQRATTASENFAWGVVAVNTNKPTYHPGERAEFTIVVLDYGSFGVKGAAVEMTLETPNGKKEMFSTQDRTILETTTPGIYMAYYSPRVEGTFHVSVHAAGTNVNAGITTTFDVRSRYAFDIERFTPTMINPEVQPIQMDIKITPLMRGFDGLTVKEFLPADLNVVEASEAAQVEDRNGVKVITWNFHNRNVLDPVRIHYQYTVPKDKKPWLYYLGPLLIEWDRNKAFEEARTWMIAIDANALAIRFFYRKPTSPDFADYNFYFNEPKPNDANAATSDTNGDPLPFIDANVNDINVAHSQSGNNTLARTYLLGASPIGMYKGISFVSPPLVAQTVASGTWELAINCLVNTNRARPKLAAYGWKTTDTNSTRIVTPLSPTVACPTTIGGGRSITSTGNAITFSRGDKIVFEADLNKTAAAAVDITLNYNALDTNSGARADSNSLAPAHIRIAGDLNGTISNPASDANTYTRGVAFIVDGNTECRNFNCDSVDTNLQWCTGAACTGFADINTSTSAPLYITAGTIPDTNVNVTDGNKDIVTWTVVASQSGTYELRLRMDANASGDFNTTLGTDRTITVNAGNLDINVTYCQGSPAPSSTCSSADNYDVNHQMDFNVNARIHCRDTSSTNCGSVDANIQWCSSIGCSGFADMNAGSGALRIVTGSNPDQNSSLNIGQGYDANWVIRAYTDGNYELRVRVTGTTSDTNTTNGTGNTINAKTAAVPAIAKLRVFQGGSLDLNTGIIVCDMTESAFGEQPPGKTCDYNIVKDARPYRIEMRVCNDVSTVGSWTEIKDVNQAQTSTFIKPANLTQCAHGDSGTLTAIGSCSATTSPSKVIIDGNGVMLGPPVVAGTRDNGSCEWFAYTFNADGAIAGANANTTVRTTTDTNVAVSGTININSQGSADTTFVLTLPNACSEGKGCTTGGCTQCTRCYFDLNANTGTKISCEGQTSLTPFFQFDNQSNANVDLNWLADVNGTINSSISKFRLKASQKDTGYESTCTDTQPPTTTCVYVESPTDVNIAVNIRNLSPTSTPSTVDANAWFWTDATNFYNADNNSLDINSYATG
ncbi:MAG: hypothetical protein HY393_04280 [Candidatus Diapherotrites archaeon]|nr:hypothetical protein [Candidatus Diapherotrites archaeon]